MSRHYPRDMHLGLEGPVPRSSILEARVASLVVGFKYLKPFQIGMNLIAACWLVVLMSIVNNGELWVIIGDNK